jgi:hypothetical protein
MPQADAWDDLANIPVLEVWRRCRKISDDEWIGYCGDEEIHVFGAMPTNGHLLVSRKTVDGKVIVAGRIVLEGGSDGQHHPT